MRHSELIDDLSLHDYNPINFGYESCESGHCYGPAVRTYWLLHFVSSGKGFFEKNGEKHFLSKGDLFIIPPLEETYYEADQVDPWTYTWIGFTTKGEVFSGLRASVIHCPEAEHIFEEMKLCARKSKGKTEFLVAKLWELISILSSDTEVQSGYVDKAIQYMKSEYMNPITIAELATHLGIDRSYFSAIFKEQIGMPPGKYLANLRLTYAAELLSKHGMSPTTAAFSCGYADIYHFSKAFKKEFGISPRAYKLQCKKTPTERSESFTS